MPRVTAKLAIPPKREARAVPRASSGAMTSRKIATYWRVRIPHIARSAGSAGAVANWQMAAVSSASGATKQNTASQISNSWRVGERPVVWKYSPTPDFALLSPSRAAVKNPHSKVQHQSVPQAAWMRAGCTRIGFSVALEIHGRTNGRASTAKAQIAQDLRWRIVAKVRRKRRMGQFKRFLRPLQVWPGSWRWR